MSNLDFDWQDDPAERQAVSAKIIPFPMARRIRFLEHVAAMIHTCRKPDEYRARIEKQQRDAMTRRQGGRGVTDGGISTRDQLAFGVD